MNGIISAIGARTGVDVNIQDQTSQLISLYLSSLVQIIDIRENSTINTNLLKITATALPIVGNIVCLKESNRFFQAQILTVTPISGNDYDLELDSLLDYAFTTNGGCSERNININVNGSVTPVEFTISPELLTKQIGSQTIPIDWDITCISISITDNAVMDSSKFGGINKLTKGILFRFNNGFTKNIFNIKTNGEFKLNLFETEYEPKAPASVYGIDAVRRFSGQHNNGVVGRLCSKTLDTAQQLK